MSFSEEDVVRLIKAIISQSSDGLEFEELRDYLELKGVYVDSYILRKIIAKMIRENIVCKEVSSVKKRFLLKLCR